MLIEVELENENGTCMIEGGKVGQHIELEGAVDSGTSSSFKLKVNGERSTSRVDVTASGAQLDCEEDKTSSTTCQASLKKGSKVHVKGTLTSCTTTMAAMTATQVEVQKVEGH